MAHDVFISYASPNKIAADAVCAALEGAKIRCWIAPRDVPPGKEWPAAIADAIRESRALILVFTAAANASQQVLREVTLAGKYEKPILPFRIEPLEPSGSLEYHLATPHWLDALTPPMEAHIRRLVESVARLLGKEPPPPQPPPEPPKAKPEPPKPAPPPVPPPMPPPAPAAAVVEVAKKPAGPNYALWGLLGAGALALLVGLIGSAGSSKKADPPVVTSPEIQTKMGKFGLRYLRIPAGQFEMGCSSGDSECSGDESPRHTIRISRDLWMGQTEVTVAAFKAFAEANRVALPEGQSGDDTPVVRVTWDEASEFCQASGGRLPTEAEWEYAARAGSRAAYYGDLNQIAWTGQNSGGKVHEVGKKAPNRFGLYDMIGNVWERNSDWYDENYYPKSPSTDPPGAASGTMRSARGGSWSNYPSDARASCRGRLDPAYRVNLIGFRCAGE